MTSYPFIAGNLALDFTGGTLMQVGFSKPITTGEVRLALSSGGVEGAQIQSFAGKNSFVIRVKGKQEQVNEIAEKLLQGLRQKFPHNPPREERREYVGPAVGRHLTRQAALALSLSLLGIIVYVAFRFSNPLWGVAGVVALAHDVFITMTALSLTGRETDLVIVAALLSIAGYSINDTIVIFDRMRERMRLFHREPIGDLINNSVNETLNRTLITNGCVIAVTLAIFFFGGPVIHDFALAMLFGGIVGTYSTVAVATPLVYEWDRIQKGGRTPTPSAPPTASTPRRGVSA